MFLILIAISMIGSSLCYGGSIGEMDLYVNGKVSALYALRSGTGKGLSLFVV